VPENRSKNADGYTRRAFEGYDPRLFLMAVLRPYSNGLPKLFDLWPYADSHPTDFWNCFGGERVFFFYIGSFAALTPHPPFFRAENKAMDSPFVSKHIIRYHPRALLFEPRKGVVGRLGPVHQLGINAIWTFLTQTHRIDLGRPKYDEDDPDSVVRRQTYVRRVGLGHVERANVVRRIVEAHFATGPDTVAHTPAEYRIIAKALGRHLLFVHDKKLNFPDFHDFVFDSVIKSPVEFQPVEFQHLKRLCAVVTAEKLSTSLEKKTAQQQGVGAVDTANLSFSDLLPVVAGLKERHPLLFESQLVLDTIFDAIRSVRAKRIIRGDGPYEAVRGIVELFGEPHCFTFSILFSVRSLIELRSVQGDRQVPADAQHRRGHGHDPHQAPQGARDPPSLRPRRHQPGHRQDQVLRQRCRLVHGAPVSRALIFPFYSPPSPVLTRSACAAAGTSATSGPCSTPTGPRACGARSSA
jgi:hypothetical protein